MATIEQRKKLLANYYANPNLNINKKEIDDWVFLMNRPTKNEPYGTEYSFKELYRKYVIPNITKGL